MKQRSKKIVEMLQKEEKPAQGYNFPVPEAAAFTTHAIAMLMGIILCVAFFKWRQSRYLTRDGYIRRLPLFGRARFEHREIAESILGRRLRPGEIVHHINGRPWDNRPDNLCAMDSEDHELYHEWYRYCREKLNVRPRRETQLARLRTRFNAILLKDVLDSRKAG